MDLRERGWDINNWINMTQLGSNGERLCSELHKILENACVADQLVDFQEGLSSMESAN
jgi:hypothetical protein